MSLFIYLLNYFVTSFSQLNNYLITLLLLYLNGFYCLPKFARSIKNIKYCIKRITSLENCVSCKLSPVYSLYTLIYRYQAPLRILFWLKNQGPFRGVKKKQLEDFHLNLRTQSININENFFTSNLLD